MTRQRLRIFVSSPGDVMAAREVAAQIIEKVAHEFARFFTIVPYLWEYEPMLASGHFQDSIDPPSRFDAVILILESRLGTLLPARTALREYRGMDGRAPVTGTEWEFEDALIAARERGVPDLLVYRSRRKAEVDTWDAQSQQELLAQFQALNAFWSRHFVDRGTFTGGYAQFSSLHDFAAKLEGDLRGCITRRIGSLSSDERAAPVRLWTTAPFRGLEAYQLEHAPIFFGRDEIIGTALLRLTGNAQAGQPFLLVLGASGSGKSSLVKAGVVPRLLVPHRVSGVAFLRRAVFRPGDTRPDEDLFDALARCLTQGDESGTGLNELLGSSMPVKELARHLREAAAHPDLPFAMVLDGLAQTARTLGRMLQYEEARLILEVDQLEELFTSERVQSEERKRFAQLLAALVRSGLVWVIATMRSDFWHRTVETPELVQLADGHGRLDLLPPTPAELSQMIRGPAEAAAIHFEAHPSSGIPLNDLIAQEAASEPGALPLLSYLLDQLYRKDVEEAGGSILTYASYNALGGLKGAIATRADAVIAAQPPEVREALRHVLFALVQMSVAEGSVERAVARSAPMSDFPEGTARWRLIEALLDPAARLVVADAAEGKAASVRLAHEALLSEWQTARDYVVGNAEALKSRRTLEERHARWLTILGHRGDIAGGRPGIGSLRARFDHERGLLADVDLIDARRLLRNYREELSPQLISYIERSERQIRRTLRLKQGAVAAIAALAVAATVAAWIASSKEREAQHQTAEARKAQRQVLTDAAAERLRDGDLTLARGMMLEVFKQRSPSDPPDPAAINVLLEIGASDPAVAILSGHSAPVRWISYSPDGSRILTTSRDHTARVWDARTGLELLRIPDVGSAQYSSDAKRIVVAAGNTVRVLEAHTGAPLILIPTPDAVHSAVYSADGARILTSFSKGVRLWDARTGARLAEFIHPAEEEYHNARFSPDASRIAVAVARTGQVWDALSGRELLVLTGHRAPVDSIAYSPDGTRLVSAGDDGTARVWDARTGTQLLLVEHGGQTWDAAFSPDGRTIATAGADKVIRVWDAATGKPLRVLTGHVNIVASAAFSPDGRHLASAAWDLTARVWDLHEGPDALIIAGHGDQVTSVAYSPDGTRLLTASADKTARIWDAHTGAPIAVLSGHDKGVGTAVYSPDGARILTVSDDKSMRIWDARTRAILLTIATPDAVTSAAYSPDGRHIVASYADGTFGTRDSSSGIPTSEFNAVHRDYITSTLYSPDGAHILTSSVDKTVRVWDAQTLSHLLLIPNTDFVLGAAYSPDGRLILSVGNDTLGYVWDARTGQELRVLAGHHKGLAAAAFSPDGRRIVTGSFDRTIRIWDTRTGTQLAVLMGHRHVVQGVCFSPDGRHVASASGDDTARIWDATIAADGRAQLLFQQAVEADPLAAVRRTNLDVPSTTALLVKGTLGADTGGKVASESSRAARCARQAGAYYDPDGLGPGLEQAAIDPEQAAAACMPRGSAEDRSAQLSYNTGRALLARHDFTGARRYFESALADGYGAARVDLALLLSDPAAKMLDARRAALLLEQSWSSGLDLAAFELGSLYEHGVAGPAEGTGGWHADSAEAWRWYEKAARHSEPHALARLAERAEREVITGSKPDAELLPAFTLYARAAEHARSLGWPDDVWRSWRYRRATLAHLLARAGLTRQVADAYQNVLSEPEPVRVSR